MLSNGKLGFWGLTALVFGLVVGVGIYNLPQNMAHSASAGPAFLAWVITGIGLLPLVYSFKWLSNHYPECNAGLYQYAQVGFGNYAGFNIAWGYWLCTAFSNVTYGIMLNDSVGAFIPSLMQHSWQTILFGSVLIWLMFFIVSRGIKTANFINTLLAAVKIVMLIFIIVVFSLYFRFDIFDQDIWGSIALDGSIATQIKNTMMVTLFCFFGIEGAVMMSARARKSSDVGKAGITGFIISLLLYISISLLCFGLMGKARLAGLQDPSVAYILRDICGEWAYWFVICALIISLLGGWVAWTLVVAQVPYEASIVKIFPKAFRKTNRYGMPAYGLAASSIAMELFFILVIFADNVYLASLHITGLMIIPCYLFTGLFVLKVAPDRKMKLLGLFITLFCLWMAYAGGLKEFMMTSIFYLLGIGFYLKAHSEYQRTSPLFTTGEKISLLILLSAAVASIILIML
ncbi:MAG: amino acid permease [Muribaculaceae bacterium]|nr:amino acid permease [Muribaculaceae bacterium]